MSDSEAIITVGKIGAPYGVKGWMHVHSYTDPCDNLLRYRPLYLQSKQGPRVIEIEGMRAHGSGIVAKLVGCDDREQVRAYTHELLCVLRNQLPVLTDGSYYWSDLVGLQVVNIEGISLGTVSRLLETAANDVLIVTNDQRQEELIPFVQGHIVQSVDLDKALITVNWEAPA